MQLGALALHRSGLEAPPGNAEQWRDLLRGLTPEWPQDEPWVLVVDDPSRPGFLQPPIPKGSADPHRTTVETPDDLDVLDVGAEELI